MKEVRKVGETWRSDYWQEPYLVLAVGLPSVMGPTEGIRVRWESGEVTTHCTPIGRDTLLLEGA